MGVPGNPSDILDTGNGTGSYSGLAEEAPFFRFLTDSVSKYSICPLMERKSSSAQAASSCHREADTRRSICFFSLPSMEAPCFSAAILVEGAAVDDRLGVLVTTEHHQQVADHSGLALLVQIDDVFVA